MPTSQRHIASVFLTPGCDLSCRFCASEDRFSTMPRQQADELIRSLPGRGFDDVVFGGGEPLLWPHGLLELAAAAGRAGLHVQVCTNGTGLDEDLAASEAVDRWILPLEAARPEVHDRLRVWRRGGAHHALVTRRIAALAAAGRELTISTVVNRDNLDELPAIARYLDGLAASGVRLHAWHLYRFLGIGRGGSVHAGALEVAADAYRAACTAVRATPRAYAVYRRDDMARSRSVAYFWFEGGELVSSPRS